MGGGLTDGRRQHEHDGQDHPADTRRRHGVLARILLADAIAHEEDEQHVEEHRRQHTALPHDRVGATLGEGRHQRIGPEGRDVEPVPQRGQMGALTRIDVIRRRGHEQNRGD